MHQIRLLEPFLGGSHGRWARGWQANSTHQIELIGLPARHWKWRMHGAAVSFAQQLAGEPEPGAYLATDMLDLATFRGLLPTKVPILLYFHENQLTYPWSPTDQDPPLQRDRHYGWINYTSSLTADSIAFNSDYHKSAFLSALLKFLGDFPDHVHPSTVDDIAQKSRVIPLGMNLPVLPDHSPRDPNAPPVLVWNHRWEYDKDPEAFFAICEALAANNQDFRLIVLGEQHRRMPAIFSASRQRWADRILHWGYASERADYWAWLQRGDFLPVTSRQDFFGLSTVEGIHAGLTPLLPRRLAFPEHLPGPAFDRYYYDSPDELHSRLTDFITASISTAELSAAIQRYHWRHIAPVLDEWISSAIRESHRKK